jgi:hypothetical protein
VEKQLRTSHLKSLDISVKASLPQSRPSVRLPAFVAMSCIFVIGLFSPLYAVANQKAQPVVVELYTAEGCPACPAAEAVVSRIVREQNQQRETTSPVLFLQWHVDYFNTATKRDPYSSAYATARQRMTGQSLKSSLYTPQMIVNGQEIIAGRDEKIVREKVAAAFAAAHAPRSIVNISPQIVDVQSTAGQQLRVKWSAIANQAADLDIMITENDLETSSGRTTFFGKELRHDAVVRSVKSLSLPSAGREARGTMTLALPTQFRRENSQLIAVLRSRGRSHIIAATRLPLSPN